MGPDVMAVYPQVAAAIDWDLADSAVCQALKVRCHPYPQLAAPSLGHKNPAKLLVKAAIFL
jgi:hypothetical protein